MAERVGFNALNVESCTALHIIVQTQEIKHLLRFRFPLGLIRGVLKANSYEKCSTAKKNVARPL
jgi:hypothetical protein